MKKTLKKLILLALCTATLASLTGCGEKAAHKQLFAMDTVMTLTAYGKNGSAGINAAVKTINDLEKILDPERYGSAVSDMNNAEGRAETVPESILSMLATAKTVYDQSNGALDLTVYPLSKLWGFIDLESGGTGYVPTPEEISDCMQNLNFDEITVSGNTVTMPKGTQIGFGAVAKGYTSDAVANAIKQQGVESAVVSLGGNVQTIGLKPDGSNWTVAVEDPASVGSYIGTLSVGETAVITSGSYQRYFEKDGKTYHHIIDPHTGSPAESGLKSVTVVCKDGALADCLSTALFVLGKDGAINYWRTYGGFEMMMVTDGGIIICTSGLKGMFTPEKSNYPVTYVK